MESTLLSEHLVELLEQNNNDEDETLTALYDRIQECSDRNLRRSLITDYNVLANQVNTSRKFRAYKLLK